MNAIQTALIAADENYLVALANKGLFKRAQRELLEAAPLVTLEEEKVTVSFADGIEVVITENIQNYTCTCPSRSTCKHLLMAVLAAQAKLVTKPVKGETKNPAATLPDYSHLERLNAKDLEKIAGKRLLKSAILAVQMGEKCTIEENSTLRITLADSGYSVLFLPGAPLTDARCTCKATSFCAHRAQAIVQYIKHRKGALTPDFTPEEPDSDLDFSAHTLPYIRSFITEVLGTGLVRIPDDTAGRFLQLATICHSQRLANMERLCNRISGQLTFFLDRSATFTRDLLISDLCTLLRLCEEIEAGNITKKTIGVFRETYRPVPQMDLWALGAYGWHSTGGYKGITMPFFCPESRRIYTYTSVLPVNMLFHIDKLYQAIAPWGLPGSLATIADITLRLKGGKVSNQGQLSASESGIATPLDKLNIMVPELSPLRFDDFSILLEAVWAKVESGENNPLAILIPAQTGASSFDAITQKWFLPLQDKNKRTLNLVVRSEKSTDRLLDNLAYLEKNSLLCQPMLVRVSFTGGALTAFPITLYGERPFQLSLDLSKKDKESKKNQYNWGASV